MPPAPRWAKPTILPRRMPNCRRAAILLMIGCTVLHADDGRTLGIVAKVDHPGVQDIYIVRDAAGEEHWIPAVPEFVVDVDIAARTVKMRPIAGMFDEPVNGDEE